MEALTQKDLDVLRKEFPKERLSVKVQAFNKEKTRAMLVAYLQHCDVQQRLDEVDPAWSCMALEQKEIGETVYVRMRMTVKGVSRENVGEGDHPKSAYSDALKRCAMLFGIGRYLYNGEQKWVSYNEKEDRYREWTIEDYLGRKQASEPEQTTWERARARKAPALGEQVVTFGRKFQGFKFKEIDVDELHSYVKFLQEQSEGGEPLSAGARAFIEKASEYLSTKEGA